MNERRNDGARQKKCKVCMGFVESLEARQLLSVASAAPPPLDPALGYQPSQVRRAYGFDQISFANGTIPGDGRGQTIAIVDAQGNPTIKTDLQTFDTQFGLPAPPSFKVVDQRGGDASVTLNNPDPGWAGEIALDVEWSHAIAPMANILLIETDDQDFSNLMAGVDFARHQPGVSVVSMSFGGSEFFQYRGGEGDQRAFDPIFNTPAGHQGVTFVAAAGDHTAQAGILWPSAYPNVLSVGGTSLNFSDAGGTYGNEIYWSGTNSGYSNLEPEPRYQVGVQGTGFRSTPDVTYNADPTTGVAVFSDFAFMGWTPIGGTSAGAPQWSALITIANQGRALNGLGTLDGPTQTLPILYSLYSPPQTPGYATYAKYFNDVNQTGTDLIGTGLNDTGPIQGFDTATGLGSPKAAALVPALTMLSAPPASPIVGTVVKAPPSAVRAGDPVLLKVQLTNKAGAIFDAPVSINLFASPTTGTPTLNPVGTVPLGMVRLKPGVPKTMNLKFTFPNNLTKGSYMLSGAVFTSSSNTTPAPLSVKTPVTITPRTVDLAVDVPAGETIRVTPGAFETALVKITNVGNFDASGVANLSFYASTDKKLDGSDTLLPISAPSVKIRLQPGRSTMRRVRFYAPTNRTPGSYFLLASISSITVPKDTNAANDVAAIATRA